ncbi:hypothetical protein BJ165DRAFT_1597073 [Panaeolus papilionaceus]|nr:hypothetical protein BJ165DRAFT_1597073 [Panaeolus papilionaceus]
MTTSNPTYETLRISGPLRVVSTTPEELKGECVALYILMGPTGAGKSSFTESLAPGQNISISKNSLESVTQEVTCYRVVNLADTYDYNYIVMDTPGFLDTKLSESRITYMITEKLERICQSADRVSIYIIYFQPITDIRMGGSKRDAVKMLKGFAKAFRATGINVVTTMWNLISTSKQLEDANSRLIRLEKDIFELEHVSTHVAKFQMNQHSALSVLYDLHNGWNHDTHRSGEVDPTQYQSLVHLNLLDRITNLQQRLQILAEDKKIATIPGQENTLLLEVVLEEEQTVSAALQSFLADLAESGLGPGENSMSSPSFGPHDTTLPQAQSDASLSGASPLNTASRHDYQAETNALEPTSPVASCFEPIAIRFKQLKWRK